MVAGPMLLSLVSAASLVSGDLHDEEEPPGLATEAMGHHRVYQWVSTESGRENELISPEAVVEQHGIPEKAVFAHINSELKEESDVKSLPGALLLVLLFILMSLTRENMAAYNSLEDAIDSVISRNANFAFTDPDVRGHKTYQDVNSFADFWSWMNKGFMPLTHMDNVTVSEGSSLNLGPLNFQQGRYFLWNNRRMGPIRLAQEVADVVECPNRPMAGKYPMSCGRGHSLQLDLKPHEASVAKAFLREEKSRTVWLNGGQEENKARLRQLEADLWLHAGTFRIQVSFVLYNENLDLLTLTHVNFLFARSGHIWKMLTHRTFKLAQYAAWGNYVYDALFYAHVTMLLFTESRELYYALVKSGGDPVQGLRDYVGFWNMVDWVVIIASYVILAVWVVRVSAVRSMQDELVGLPAGADTCSEHCGDVYAKLFHDMEEVGEYTADSRLLAAFYPLVILLRLFKAFAAQPRLALVTDTLYQASSQLAHFLIVFAAVFGTYAVMGVAFFGREDAAFSTLDRAIPTLWRSFFGSFNVDSMNDVGRPFAFFFFFTFQVLIVLVMLAMLIAIIMEVYVDVKRHAKNSDPLWVECYQLVHRAVLSRQGKQLSLASIRARYFQSAGTGSGSGNLAADSSEELVLASSLQAKVPGISSEQAHEVLVDAAARWAKRHAAAVEPEELLGAVEAVVRLLGQVKRKVQATRTWNAAFYTGAHSSAPPDIPRGLEAVPLADLLRAAALRLEMDGQTPQWPNAAGPLKQLVESATIMHRDIKFGVKV